MDADIRSTPNDPDYCERLAEVAEARQAIESALQMLLKPTLWQRINMWVNHEAAKDELRERAMRAAPNGATLATAPAGSRS
jgi:hypothetical protein